MSWFVDAAGPFLMGGATGGWWSRRKAVGRAVAKAEAAAEARATAQAQGGSVYFGGTHGAARSGETMERAVWRAELGRDDLRSLVSGDGATGYDGTEFDNDDLDDLDDDSVEYRRVFDGGQRVRRRGPGQSDSVAGGRVGDRRSAMDGAAEQLRRRAFDR